MERIARRAPGSADMRAALAALYWHQGKEEQAEDEWEFACNKITVRSPPGLIACGFSALRLILLVYPNGRGVLISGVWQCPRLVLAALGF